MLGVVEQAVGEVVGGAQLAQAADGGCEGRSAGLVAVAGGQAGAGQLAFGPQHGPKMPGHVGVEQGEQLACGGITQVVGGAGGQRPRPAEELVADAEGSCVREGGAGVAQRVQWLAAGVGGGGFQEAD